MRYNRFAFAIVILLVVSLSRAGSIKGLHLIDLDGLPRTLAADEARATVMIFLGTQCPISNRYIPLLNDLAKAHENDGLEMFAVVSDPTITRKNVIAYRDEYKIAFPVLFDASGELARELKPTHTPEAFVLDHDGALRYRGRIDDGFAALGKINQVVKSNDLSDAISALLANRPIEHPQTDPVGCPFEAWDAKMQAAKLTYTRDIAPIVNANCIQCHRAGEIAPFPLTSYTDVAK